MKKAASLLELVVAIVVMGIAVMALPLMLDRVQKNNQYAMHQEAVLAARTYLGDILTYQWDENTYLNEVVAVLDTTSGDNEFNRLNDTAGNPTTRRNGHLEADKRRKMFTNPRFATTKAGLGAPDATAINDLDDFDNTVNLAQATVGEEALTGLDYKLNDMNMTIDTTYINDSTDYSQNDISFIFRDNDTGIGNADSTNIKMLTITLQGTNVDTFRLRAYSANIGGGELQRRDINEW